MALVSRLAIVASACSAVAIAAWLLPASVHIADWPADGPERIAYFEPLVECRWAVSVAVAAFAAAILVARRAGDRNLAATARLLAPLQWLWLWTVPFGPLVPDRLPLLLVFAGPVRLMVAAAVAAAIAIRVVRARRVELHAPRIGRPTIFAVSLALYLLAAFNWHGILGLIGDEPHFLVITHSLLVDRDLDISNNHERGDYRAFFGGELRPDYLTRGKHGEIYGNHPPGLPALLVPAYAIAGAAGAIVFMAFVGALTAVAIFDIATLSGGPTVALLTWAAVCLSVPFVPHAWQVYPEIPGALIVAWTVLWLIEPPSERAIIWIGRGAALGLLPWWHTRYATLMAPLAAFLALHLIWHPRRGALVTAFATPLAVSLALWFWSFYVMYGVFDPQAPYGSFTDMFVRNSNIARGVFGLLIDPKFGLLMFAPVYAFAAAGAAAMWRRREDRLLLAALVGAATVYVASTTRLYIWWGGSSAGARFLVPILPLLTPFVALAAATLRHSAAALLRVAVVVGFVIAAFGLVSPLRFLLSDAHGQSVLLTELQGSAPLAPVWPTWTEPPPWLPQLTRFAQALAGRFDARTRAATVRAGREALLEEDDASRLRPFDYARGRRADAAVVIARAVLDVRRVAGELSADAQHVAGPFALPAGVFSVRIWFAGERPLSAPAFVRYHRGPALASTQTVSGGLATIRLTTPVPAPIVWVGVAEADAARVERVEIQPEAIVPRSERPQFEPIAIEPLERPGSLLAYADRNSWPEGGVFWTRSTRTAVVYIAPAGASQATLTVHIGPNAGIVNIEVGQERHEVAVPHDGVVDLVVSLPRGVAAVPVRVSAPAGFTPAALDPHSTDTRNLGCQIRIHLR